LLIKINNNIITLNYHACIAYFPNLCFFLQSNKNVHLNTSSTAITTIDSEGDVTSKLHLIPHNPWYLVTTLTWCLWLKWHFERNGEFLMLPSTKAITMIAIHYKTCTSR